MGRGWGASLSGAHGHSVVVSLNCCIVGGAIVVIVIAGNIELIVVLQRCKWVVVACGPLMDKMHTMDAHMRCRVKRRRGAMGVEDGWGSIVAHGGA